MEDFTSTHTHIVPGHQGFFLPQYFDLLLYCAADMTQLDFLSIKEAFKRLRASGNVEIALAYCHRGTHLILSLRLDLHFNGRSGNCCTSQCSAEVLRASLRAIDKHLPSDVVLMKYCTQKHPLTYGNLSVSGFITTPTTEAGSGVEAGCKCLLQLLFRQW